MYTKLVHRTVLITLLALAFPAASFAEFFGVGVTVGFAPPVLPVYVQPPCPAPGYIWTPGYWAYSADAADYYWVPGTWVLAPAFGLLWTPGYWGLVDAQYVWHEGYWGPHVGFYGGINYGFGYFGSGFAGGYWRGHDFYYNRAVANVSSVNITNVYNRTVINHNSELARASFNGKNGVEASPSRRDLLAQHEPHRALTAPQRAQVASARTLPSSLASVNHGRPQVATTTRPGMVHGQGVTAPRYSKTTVAATSHQSHIDRSRGLSTNRDSTTRTAPTNARTHSSAPPQYRSSQLHEQSRPAASAERHGGFGSSMEHTRAAESPPTTAHWTPPSSHRTAQPNRMSPPQSPPPNRARFAEAPRGAAGSHNAPQSPHVNHEASAQGERRS